MMRGSQLAACSAIAILVLSGCLQSGTGTARDGVAPAGTEYQATVRVLDATSNSPVFLARVTVVGQQGALVAVTTDQNGTAPVVVKEGATGLEVGANGYLPQQRTLEQRVRSIVVRLQPLTDAVANFTSSSGLQFRTPVDLGSKSYVVAVGTSCLSEDSAGDRDANCGLGEPSVEVDGRGTIYVTGVCCIGNAPPIYVSRDDGKTFRELATPTGIREKFGIEGDFAIDEQGTMYFADIELAATFQLTAWDKDGQYLRHMKWPARPIVDRDWIRAEGNGKLYYVYNTGSSTEVYRSQDGGMTWDARSVFSAPYGLGNAVKGTKPGELWLLGGSSQGFLRADYTLDGGSTWKQEATTAVRGGSFPTGAFDEAGHLFVATAQRDEIFVTHRTADGKWDPTVRVSPPLGHHRMPWIAAAGPGKVAVAWYGTLEESESAKWYLFVAVTLDGHEVVPHWQVAIADPEPVLVGTLGRQLLDFLQAEIGPDGSIHVAYSKLRPNEPNNEEQLHYVHSEPTLPLAASRYPFGPRAAS